MWRAKALRYIVAALICSGILLVRSPKMKSIEEERGKENIVLKREWSKEWIKEWIEEYRLENKWVKNCYCDKRNWYKNKWNEIDKGWCNERRRHKEKV